MAPGIETAINLAAIQTVDILQTYFLLFEHMIKDFVHIEDLKLALANSPVLGSNSAGPIVGGHMVSLLTDAMAKTKSLAYSAMAKSGAAAREGLITGVEVLTS